MIPQQVLDPLLAGALFFVDTAGNDILAAREEHRRLSTPVARDGGNPASPAENLQRLAQTLDEYRRKGRPLPLVRDLPPETVGDPLARVNLRLLARQAGLARLSRLTLSAEQRELLLGSLDDLGTAPGGLRTPISEVIPFGGDGPPAPWREPIGPWELRPSPPAWRPPAFARSPPCRGCATRRSSRSGRAASKRSMTGSG